MKKYVVLNKKVGETPLECAEKWRAQQTDEYQSVVLAYAGRLDPMASGKLLILIGDECKKQQEYHGLDKEYVVEMIFGIGSDSGDVLGIVSEGGEREISSANFSLATNQLIDSVSLPYPIFSAKTVKGKPLHTWTMEGRLHEIDIPNSNSIVHQFSMLNTKSMTRGEIYKYAVEKIATVPPVKDERKALGNDFRRPDVLKSWKQFLDSGNATDEFTVVKCKIVASSGTYMRSLAKAMGQELGTKAFALSIDRTRVGKLQKLGPIKFWYPNFK